VVERIEVTVTEPVVRYEVADRVATVTLNRPEVAMP
jgi:enoyl-CoA hydratase/carnithine racemase